VDFLIIKVCRCLGDKGFSINALILMKDIGVGAIRRFGFERHEVKMKVIKIGIASQEKIRERVLAIAKGEIKPKASDPKIWFTSMRSLSQVLSDENRALGASDLSC
jgi:hypothetical protein